MFQPKIRSTALQLYRNFRPVTALVTLLTSVVIEFTRHRRLPVYAVS